MLEVLKRNQNRQQYCDFTNQAKCTSSQSTLPKH